MSLFKRIGEVLTPPPTKRPSNPPTQPGKGPDEQLNEQLRGMIREILVSETVDGPQAQHAEAKLRQLAEKHDSYIIAARLQMQMEALSLKLGNIDTSRYDRIYALSGELVLRHVLHEVAAIESGESKIGPNVFSTYCADLIGNILEGKGIASAIEVAVQITDRLLFDAVDSLEKRDVFLNMAEVAMRQGCDQVIHAAEQRRNQPLVPAEDPVAARRATVTDGENYVRELHRQVIHLRDSCAEVEAQPALNKAALRGSVSREQITQQLRYLHALMEAARPSGHLPFRARIEERAGLLLSVASKDKSAKAFQSAGHHFEAQGDKDAAVNLINLAAGRYRRAAQVYSRGEDVQGLDRIKRKMGTAPKPESNLLDSIPPELPE